MAWVSVYGSSNIQAVSYDPASRMLQVKFLKGGDVYTYFDVTADEWEELLQAPSKGRYVQIQLKRSHRYMRGAGDAGQFGLGSSKPPEPGFEG